MLLWVSGHGQSNVDDVVHQSLILRSSTCVLSRVRAKAAKIDVIVEAWPVFLAWLCQRTKPWKNSFAVFLFAFNRILLSALWLALSKIFSLYQWTCPAYNMILNYAVPLALFLQGSCSHLRVAFFQSTMPCLSRFRSVISTFFPLAG